MSDNVYFQFGCPPKMQDGRHVRNWLPHDTVEARVQTILNARDEHDYRQKLQSGGSAIMKDILTSHLKRETCQCNGKPCRLNQ